MTGGDIRQVTRDSMVRDHIKWKHVRRYKKILQILEIGTNIEKSCSFRENNISKISNSSQPLIEK